MECAKRRERGLDRNAFGALVRHLQRGFVIRQMEYQREGDALDFEGA